MVNTKELKQSVMFITTGEDDAEAILNEFITWLIANEAFQLAARLGMEWDKE